MKFQNLSVKRLFGRVAIGLAFSMSGITIALFLVTKQTAALLTGGALLLCALVGIFVLTQAFGKRLSQFTADLCQTLDHMIAGNEAPQRPEDSETQLARIGHRMARLYQIMQENRRRVDEERQELQTLASPAASAASRRGRGRPRSAWRAPRGCPRPSRRSCHRGRTTGT